MHSGSLVGLLGLIVLVHVVSAQDDYGLEKRAMRNALVRFGRSGMRNALVRFGKRSGEPHERPAYAEDKRTGAPQPFVRFGRSSGHAEHITDLLNTLSRLQLANDE